MRLGKELKSSFESKRSTRWDGRFRSISIDIASRLKSLTILNVRKQRPQIPWRSSSVSINAFLGLVESFCFQVQLVGFKLTICLRGLQTQAVHSNEEQLHICGHSDWQISAEVISYDQLPNAFACLGFFQGIAGPLYYQLQAKNLHIYVEMAD